MPASRCCRQRRRGQNSGAAPIAGRHVEQPLHLQDAKGLPQDRTGNAELGGEFGKRGQSSALGQFTGGKARADLVGDARGAALRAVAGLGPELRTPQRRDVDGHPLAVAPDRQCVGGEEVVAPHPLGAVAILATGRFEKGAVADEDTFGEAVGAEGIAAGEELEHLSGVDLTKRTGDDPERTVARALRHRLIEAGDGRRERERVRDQGSLAVVQVDQRGKVGLGGSPGELFGSGCLDERAGLRELGQCRAAYLEQQCDVAADGVDAGPAHHRPTTAAAADLEQRLRLEDAQRLAQRLLGHGERRGQLRLGWEPLIGGELAGQDHVPQVDREQVGDLRWGATGQAREGRPWVQPRPRHVASMACVLDGIDTRHYNYRPSQ